MRLLLMQWLLSKAGRSFQSMGNCFFVLYKIENKKILICSDIFWNLLDALVKNMI